MCAIQSSVHEDVLYETMWEILVDISFNGFDDQWKENSLLRTEKHHGNRYYRFNSWSKPSSFHYKDRLRRSKDGKEWTKRKKLGRRRKWAEEEKGGQSYSATFINSSQNV